MSLTSMSNSLSLLAEVERVALIIDDRELACVPRRVVHVVDELVTDGLIEGVYSEALIEALRAGGRKTLDDCIAVVRQHALEPESELLQTFGHRVAHHIVEQAKDWPADLIVMGTHGRRGIRRLLMGSDAEMVLRTAPVPLLLVREQPEAA